MHSIHTTGTPQITHFPCLDPRLYIQVFFHKRLNHSFIHYYFFSSQPDDTLLLCYMNLQTWFFHSYQKPSLYCWSLTPSFTRFCKFFSSYAVRLHPLSFSITYTHSPFRHYHICCYFSYNCIHEKTEAARWHYRSLLHIQYNLSCHCLALKCIGTFSWDCICVYKSLMS